MADALTDEQERNGLVGHHGREAHPLVRRRDDAVVLHRRLDRSEVLGLRLLHLGATVRLRLVRVPCTYQAALRFRYVLKAGGRCA